MKVYEFYASDSIESLADPIRYHLIFQGDTKDCLEFIKSHGVDNPVLDFNKTKKNSDLKNGASLSQMKTMAFFHPMTKFILTSMKMKQVTWRILKMISKNISKTVKNIPGNPKTFSSGS